MLPHWAAFRPFSRTSLEIMRTQTCISAPRLKGLDQDNGAIACASRPDVGGRENKQRNRT